MFNKAISTQCVPRYLSSDNDPLFLYHCWQANLRVHSVKEFKSDPHLPVSHPFAERLTGTIAANTLTRCCSGTPVTRSENRMLSGSTTTRTVYRLRLTAPPHQKCPGKLRATVLFSTRSAGSLVATASTSRPWLHEQNRPACPQTPFRFCSGIVSYSYVLRVHGRCVRDQFRMRHSQEASQ
jgi:hypothetical protein